MTRSMTDTDPIALDRLTRQRARVNELHRLYGEQVRGPMTTDDALWEALKEASSKLRMMEMELESDADRD